MRDKLLIMDDEPINVELLANLFADEYQTVAAADGAEALEQFKKHENSLIAVLLDIQVKKGDMTGYEALKVLNEAGKTSEVPVIMITASNDMETAYSCYSAGAMEFIGKPIDARVARKRIMNMIELYSGREKLKERLEFSEQRLRESRDELERFNENFIDTISDVVEFRDMESGQHVKRVKGLTRIMAEAYAVLYPERGLQPHEIELIEKASALHDIGKISIPDHVLLKPGKLTAEEWEIMKQHTTKGCVILSRLSNLQDAEHYKIAYDIVRHHHERYDGKGYPDGLKGEEIPLSARLVSVADVYDALTADRVYRRALDRETAHRMITEGECGVFDPKLIGCFEYSRKEMEAFIAFMSGKKV